MKRIFFLGATKCVYINSTFGFCESVYEGSRGKGNAHVACLTWLGYAGSRGINGDLVKYDSLSTRSAAVRINLLKKKTTLCKSAFEAVGRGPHPPSLSMLWVGKKMQNEFVPLSRRKRKTGVDFMRESLRGG